MDKSGLSRHNSGLIHLPAVRISSMRLFWGKANTYPLHQIILSTAIFPTVDYTTKSTKNRQNIYTHHLQRVACGQKEDKSWVSQKLNMHKRGK